MTWYIFAGFAVVFGVIVIALLNYGKREVEAEVKAQEEESELLLKNIESIKRDMEIKNKKNPV